MTKRFLIVDRVKSLGFAFTGIATMIRTQHNAWIHLASTLTVVSAGIWFGVSREEWAWLVLAIVAVWTAEALNTAFELMCDVASPEFHPLVKQAKDVAAGAVLIAAFGATIVGLLVFAPRLIVLFGWQ
ncbi:MAG: diacylglycerol kinase family protein [Alphaproteobacteria bacterium]|nr:diacylglycerol kinase family protein [Alphaproteobacteria bacterium]